MFKTEQLRMFEASFSEQVLLLEKIELLQLLLIAARKQKAEAL